MHMLTYFKHTVYNIDDYPNSYKHYACEISLPIYPQLSIEEVDYIIESVINTVQLQLSISPLKTIA
jgi:dTDP-4-amino-4,6-dideoxygalactose transaminase